MVYGRLLLWYRHSMACPLGDRIKRVPCTVVKNCFKRLCRSVRSVPSAYCHNIIASFLQKMYISQNMDRSGNILKHKSSFFVVFFFHLTAIQYKTSVGLRPGGVLPYRRLMGMCRWMGSHFHDWIDCNRVFFSTELLEMGPHIFGFLGVRQFFIHIFC